MTTNENSAGWLFVSPALLFLGACFFLPVAIMVALSFDPIHQTEWGIFDNYARFFGQAALLSSLWNSLLISSLVAMGAVFVGYPLAAAIAFGVPERRQRMVLVLLLLPFWTSYVIRSYSWLLVLAPNGIVNSSLKSLGIINAPLRLNFSVFATVVGFVHFFSMLAAIIIYAGLRQIDRRVILAAGDLGSGAVLTWRRIILPISLPSVAVAAFLSFVMCIGDYVTPQILGGNTRPVLPQAIMEQLNRSNDLPMAAALAFILTSVVLMVTALCVPLYRARTKQ